MNHQLDKQQVEILGRNFLVSQIIAEGLEVAMPLRDEGVDLVVYTGRASQSIFNAVPIQLKVASDAVFSVDTKYQAFPSMILAYVWGIQSAEGMQLHLMTYRDALEVAEELGWTRTKALMHGGIYTTNKPSQRVLEAIAKHEYHPGLMQKLLNDIVS